MLKIFRLSALFIILIIVSCSLQKQTFIFEGKIVSNTGSPIKRAMSMQKPLGLIQHKLP